MTLLSLAPAVTSLPTGEEPPGAFAQLLTSVWQALSDVTGAQTLFFVFAVMALGCAIATVSQRNAVVAAVWLVASFFCVAACYIIFSATFLAALQVLVYAGAMMVLFVFVVMVLDVDDDGKARASKTRGSRRWPYFGVVGVLLAFMSWLFLGTVARQFTTPGRPISDDFGSAEAVGRELFGPALFGFEAISLLLLAAVIGAVVVARSRRERVKEALQAGLGEDDMHTAGLSDRDGVPRAGQGPEHGDLPDAQVRQPHPAMNFGQPSAGGHEGGS